MYSNTYSGTISPCANDDSKTTKYVTRNATIEPSFNPPHGVAHGSIVVSSWMRDDALQIWERTGLLREVAAEDGLSIAVSYTHLTLPTIA